MTKRWMSIAVAVGAVSLGWSVVAQTPPLAFDLVIRNARVADGTGAPWFTADVGIRGDVIAAVRRGLPATGRVIDAGGQVLAPGFIDIHTHARRGIFDVPTADNYVRQGVTTLMEGNDGSSPLPLAPFLSDVERERPAVNFGSFVGQGSVREAVFGNVNRRATLDELEKMRALVRDAMRDGAFGLSSGLVYAPGTFTPPDEVQALAREAAAQGGIYISHMRDEAAHVVDSVQETIAVGEIAGLPAQITHHKVIGTGNWGRSTETLDLIGRARQRGVDVTIDQYPYTASSTGISVLLPRWALEGSADDVAKRLKDTEQRAKIKEAIAENIRVDRGGGDPKNVQIASCAWEPSLAGQTLADVTRGRGVEPTIDNAAETVMWIVERGGAQAIFHAIGEEDLGRILASPWTMIGSDGEIPIFGRASPHPRSYGTFVRVLGVYVREKRILTLEEAVKKMSSMPAARLGLFDRGLVREGLRADLVLFDPARVRDTATFERPHSYAEGISLVTVNGVVVFDGQAMTGERPGRILRGRGAAR